MNKKESIELAKLLGLSGHDVPVDSMVPALGADLQNWAKLHPVLAALKPNAYGMKLCRQYLFVELSRAEGPRPHIVDRLYKRLSNLRREFETRAIETQTGCTFRQPTQSQGA